MSTPSVHHEDAPTRTTSPARPDEQPPPTSTAGPVLLGITFVVGGGLWLLAALGVDLPATVVAPAVLVCLGLAVIVSGIRGEEHAGIGLAVFVGVWLAIGVTVMGVFDVPLTGTVGEHRTAPTDVTALEDEQRLFAGSITLDLRDLELPPGTTTIETSVVMGEIRVLVPEGMALRVDGATAAGELTLLGERVEGAGLSATAETPTWSSSERRVDLTAHVGLGQVHVGGG